MKNIMRLPLVWLVLMLVAALVAGCGDDTDTRKTNTELSRPAQRFTLSGKIRNLRSGAMLVLQNNGGDDVIVRSGDESFSFPVKVLTGKSYDVKVSRQLGQVCTVENGAGTVASADVTNIVVACSDSDDVQLASERKAFTATLLLEGGFAVPVAGRVKTWKGADPTIRCADKIESKTVLQTLNERIKLDRLTGPAPGIQANNDFPGKLEQKAIFLSLGELKKCKESGDAWRSENYFPEILDAVNKGYAELMASMVSLYAKKIGYGDYGRKQVSIHKEFAAQIKGFIREVHSHEAGNRQLTDAEQQQGLEIQQAEKSRLDAIQQQEEQKRQAELKRKELAAQQEEERMMRAEEQRVKDEQLQKQQRIEQEKQFQPLYQRQKFQRLR